MNTTTKAKLIYWWCYRPKWFIQSLFEKNKIISDLTVEDFKINRGKIISCTYKGRGFYDLTIKIDKDILDNMFNILNDQAERAERVKKIILEKEMRIRDIKATFEPCKKIPTELYNEYSNLKKELPLLYSMWNSIENNKVKNYET
jgi:hypothetical protein